MDILEQLLQQSSVISAQIQGMIVIKPDMIGTRTYLAGVPAYVEIMRHAGSGTWIPVAFLENGEYYPLFPGVPFNGLPVKLVFQNLLPPKNVFSYEEFESVPQEEPKEVFQNVVEAVRQFVKMPSEVLYEFLATYIMYTWMHNLFGKKPNLYVTGFFGTGKSVVGNLVRMWGRHPVDLLQSFTSSNTWVLGIARGVAILDETDRLSATFRMILRRMHDSGINITKMMSDTTGWNILSFDISAPIIFIGTHLPEDPALLSRGFIIKMHYGRPPKRLATESRDVSIIRAYIAKSVLPKWKEYVNELEKASKEVEEMEIHERYKDMLIPLIAMARLCKADYGWAYAVAQYSSVASMYQLRTNRAIAFLMKWLYEDAPRAMGMITVTEREFAKMLTMVKDLFNLTDADLRYIEQYFISSSEPCMVDGSPGFCFVEDDIVGVKRLFFGNLININRRKDEISLGEV